MTPREEVDVRLGWKLWIRRSLCDETVIDEVVERNCYRLDAADLAGKTVIDCGAHVGVFSTFCAYLGAARVFAVEPQPENLELLRLNVAPFPQINVASYAIGATEGTAHMRGESGGAHTIIRSSDHEPDCIEVEQVELASLIDGAHVVRSGDHERVTLLKLDMEGGEVDALLACPHESLALVDRIVLESHGPGICPWVERPRVGEIVEHLLYTHNVEASGFPDRLGLVFAMRNADRTRYQ